MTAKKQPITSVDHQGRTCALRTSGGVAIHQGFVALSFRGERWVITGGRAPHKAGSTGKVWATPFPADPDRFEGHDSEFFPTVFDLVWVPIPAEAGKAKACA